MAAGCVLLDCSTVSPGRSARAARTHRQLRGSSHCHLENVPLSVSLRIRRDPVACICLMFCKACCFGGKSMLSCSWLQRAGFFCRNPIVLQLQDLICCLWSFETVFGESRYFYACTDGSPAVGSVLLSLFAWLSLSKTMRFYNSDDKWSARLTFSSKKINI